MSPLPMPWPPVPLDISRVTDMPVLRCGLPAGRCAIRVPQQLGMRAYAYLRWAAHRRLGQPPGAVVLDRRSHTVYFLVMTPQPAQQDRVTRCLERAPAVVRFLGKGAHVWLPHMGHRSQAWLGECREPTDLWSVFSALRIAARVRVGPEAAERVTLSQAACAEYLGTFSRALQTAR